MKITGEQTIPAAQDRVWHALNDPEVLRQSIPGCMNLERTGEHAFKATIETKIGPIKATFDGDVHLSDLDPPNSYMLSGKGSAGSMGSAKGSARVRLAPNGHGTRLTYDVDADVTGKFAQLGSRLVQGTANMLAGQFFARFNEAVSNPDVIRPSQAAKVSIPWWVWAVPAAAIAAAAYFLLMRGA
jgi:carbon monoxide dehydrogenase subunit G